MRIPCLSTRMPLGRLRTAYLFRMLDVYAREVQTILVSYLRIHFMPCGHTLIISAEKTCHGQQSVIEVLARRFIQEPANIPDVSLKMLSQDKDAKDQRLYG